MKTKLKTVYWKSDKFWVGKLLEHPEIMTQGETFEGLEENMKDAYMIMTMEDVPEKHNEIKDLSAAEELVYWKKRERSFRQEAPKTKKVLPGFV